jgi:DNA-binding transcriptional regulator YhcF (GntR family)
MSVVHNIGALDETIAGPRYIRLQNLIRDAVKEQRLGVGQALPSERELCDSYGLSRVTIRKAIDGLVEDGLLERRQGAGTFVMGRQAASGTSRVEKSFAMLSSFSEDMLARAQAGQCLARPGRGRGQSRGSAGAGAFAAFAGLSFHAHPLRRWTAHGAGAGHAAGLGAALDRCGGQLAL